VVRAVCAKHRALAEQPAGSCRNGRHPDRANPAGKAGDTPRKVLDATILDPTPNLRKNAMWAKVIKSVGVKVEQRVALA
jgi:hypothetical protein